MDRPTREELIAWTSALSPDPLDPGDPRYVALAESGRAAVEELYGTISLSPMTTTTQLLSGPNGSGKTTELRRLGKELLDSGYQVVIVNVLNYISESAPVDVTEFLLALALGVHDELRPEPGGGEAGFGARLRELCRRLDIDLDLGGFGGRASADGVEVRVPGVRVAAGLREMKSSQPIVQELRTKLAFHLGELYAEVAGFVQEQLAPAEPPAGSVIVVDGLDKLRGTTANDVAVQQSVEALFVQHAGKLRFLSHHGVYVVPTYLQFTQPGALPYDSRVLPVPVPHVFARDAGDEPNVARTRDQLREVIGRRIPVSRVFAGAWQIDSVIDASGGHLRDLFTLLKQLTNLVFRTHTALPLTDEQVTEAVGYVARDYATLTAEQVQFLRQVAAGDGTVRPAADDVPLLARLLQGHLLLGHLNGHDWYEVHPLTRVALGLP